MNVENDSSNRIDMKRAADVLRKNDRGGYTVPTDGLYPFQWSWDSALVALGWMRLDEARAWEEAETMFRGQWGNGMVPHILFHKDAESYFPGPDVWGNTQPIPSSAISQPPIWATAIRLLYEQSCDRELADAKLRLLLPKLIAYHEWWYRERDPQNTGLVCSYHPWESGMDNSPAWDAPLAAVPEVNWSYQRRDLGHVDSDQRPHKPEYDRYLYLVDLYKRLNFDGQAIFNKCPYKVADIGIIAILHRATKDLIDLCQVASQSDGIDYLQTELSRTESAISSLWSNDERCYMSRDLITGETLGEVTTATVLPLFGGLSGAQETEAMLALIDEWLEDTKFALSSTHPSSAHYEPRRYWRGPVWPHINWVIAQSALEHGRPEIASRLRDATAACVQASGFWEYFDADTGDGCGGDNFSWTAAFALYWLAD